MDRKHFSAAVIVAAVLALDVFTKHWALGQLSHRGGTMFFSDMIPLTLTYNTGVAFGLSVGGSRWVIIAATIVVLTSLLVLFRQARPDDRLRVWSLAAVIAGATGNLVDRVRWERGVIDFIGPFDLGFANFPIFNVADMAITVGAAALAISLWLEERAPVNETASLEPEASEAV